MARAQDTRRSLSAGRAMLPGAVPARVDLRAVGAGAPRAGRWHRLSRRGLVSRRAWRGRGAARAPAPGREAGSRRGSITRSTTRSTPTDRARDRRPVGPLAPPLARYWFWIDATGRIRIPQTGAEPPADAEPRDRAATGRQGGRRCLRELSRAPGPRRRSSTRRNAPRPAGSAAPRRREARSLTARSPRSTTPAPRPCSGSPACSAARGDPARPRRRSPSSTGASAIAASRRRHGRRRPPVKLVTATLRAEAAGPATVVALVPSPRTWSRAATRVDPIVELGVRACGCAAMLPRKLRRRSPGAPRRARRSSSTAMRDPGARRRRASPTMLDELARTATPAWRGRPATRQPGRTLIYRRRPDGGVIGFSTDAAMLEDGGRATPRADEVASHARPLVLAGRRHGRVAGQRTIQRVALDETLPHLSLALVNPKSGPRSARRA